VTPYDLVLTRTGLRFMGRVFPCSIGRGGLTETKHEGDGATPKGTHGLVGMLYRPDRMPKPADWAVPIGPPDLWSDDPKDEDYNLMVRAPHAFSHERLRRADPLYDLVILTNWNWPLPKKAPALRSLSTNGGVPAIQPKAVSGYPARPSIGSRRVSDIRRG